MSNKIIFITLRDKERIEQLMLFCDLFKEQERKSIRKLHYEISQGYVVSAEKIPINVVTTNSRVVLHDLANDRVYSLTLVFPEDADPQKFKESILAPLGAALIGKKTCEIIEYSTPSGIRRCTIKAISHETRP